jgi:hypothetical protein
MTGIACEWRLCGGPVPKAGTGRPGRYCSAACRQAAHRERVRQAQAVADHAAALADARAAVAVLWPQIEPAGNAVAELAADIAPYVAERGGTMLRVLAELRGRVDQLERLAVDFGAAMDRADALEGAPPRVS